MKKQVYIVTKFKEYDSTDEKYSWATAEPTREAAEKAIKDMIAEDVDAALDGDDDLTQDERNGIIENAVEAAVTEGENTEEHDAILYYGDISAYYDIFPTYV